MTTSILTAPAPVGQPDQLGEAGRDGFDLDVRIVETGPVSSVLMANTDDGCDTVKTGDC